MSVTAECLGRGGQQELDLGIPSFTAVEERAANLLRAYPRLPLAIEVFEARARGDGLCVQPQTTRALRHDENDRDVLDALADAQLSEADAYLVHTIWTLLPRDLWTNGPDLSSGSMRTAKYAHRDRVVRWLRDVRTQTVEDRDVLMGFLALLQERINPENGVKLTELERLAHARWREIEQARDALPHLRHMQERVGQALGWLEQGYLQDYDTVTRLYLRPQPWKELEDVWHVSETTIRSWRTQALGRFADLCVDFDILRLDLMRDRMTHKRGPRR